RVRSRTDPAVFCDQLGRFLEDTRGLLRSSGTALSKHVDGAVTGAKFAPATSDRRNVSQRSLVAFPGPLTDDFVLCIKHNAGFLAMLDALAARFRTYAVVRNPLAILASWQTLA